MACAPSEDSDQPGHPPSLIRIFADRKKKAWVFGYPLSAQRRLGQTGRMPRLFWVFAVRTCHFVGFFSLWLICLIPIPSQQWTTLSWGTSIINCISSCLGFIIVIMNYFPKCNNSLKTLLHEGLLERECYNDLVCNFSGQSIFRAIQMRSQKGYKKAACNTNIVQQTTSMVVNPIMVEKTFLFNN